MAADFSILMVSSNEAVIILVGFWQLDPKPYTASLKANAPVTVQPSFRALVVNVAT